jgi:hypothetical protein
MGIERRRSPRYHLVADAEMVSSPSHVCLKARTSDVSLVGCFMNTKYSLPLGTKIQLTLKYKGETFTGDGTVARSEPSTGFGVSFAEVKGTQQTLLRNWLLGLAVR